MNLIRDRSRGIPRARVEPHAGWYLLWLPLVPIAVDRSPEPTAAMLRLAAVLLLGILVWGLGRGPAGAWAERGFATLLLVGWFAVCGTAFRLYGVPAATPERLAVTAGLLLGPLFLLWAWRRRARMAPVIAGAAPLRSFVLVGGSLTLLDRLPGVERSDLVVLGTALALWAIFRVRGRRPRLGALG